jgi:hypothetical protein
MKQAFLSLLFLLFLSSSFSQPQKIKQKDLRKLFKIMTGEFSSEQQSKDDSAFFHIKLRMKPITLNNDGYWFYVEQSMATMQEKPYRQRVYHLYIQDDTTIVSKVFEVKNSAQYIGGWNDVSKLKNITTDSLIDRQGCGIYLHKKNKVFSGATPSKECLSSLRGATYATSEVTVYNDKLVSWDRGWNKNDKQVWGAVKGGYIFIKQRSL